ncbi:targeting for Xklp2 [Brachionus plicatilis]|uniref:Targeting for Xklp2 n=1 Tax=Brachionus plicatilis TaxID=10195 RepID=A0A3M7PUG5_BRAPC|nr:targeting for Xklp2 [Brachionus plicatilis]
MELDNLKCPQFVDFTSREAFDIHDGADFCFELGLVGELADFSALKISNEPVKVISYEQTSIFKDSTNRAAKPVQILNKTEKKPPKAIVISQSDRKKNTNKIAIPKPELAKRNDKSCLIENMPPKQAYDARVVRAPPLNLNRTRTYSKNETIILDVPAKNTRQSRSKNMHQIQTDTKNCKLVKRPDSCEKTRVPLPMYHGIKFIPKNKLPGVKSSIENLFEKSKYRSDSVSRPGNRHIDSTPKVNNSSNASSARSSSVSGLLNTEMRAYKRMEYERIKRDKERLAGMMKKELDTSRTQIEKDEIKKIRSNSVIRSNPIKLYKPFIVKPSSKPLTHPVSPNFSTKSFSYRH